MDSDVFRKVSDLDKEKIYSDLSHSKSDIQVKDPNPNSEMATLKVIGLEPRTLVCRLILATTKLEPKGELTVSFMLGGEKYFMQTDYYIANQQFYLEKGAVLYHVQRREDFRLKFPATFSAQLEVFTWNGKAHSAKIPVADLSGGGFRIVVPISQWAINMGDEVTGQLLITGGGVIPIDGKVKHIKPNGHSKDQLTCGFQFINLSDAQKNKIAGLVMDLYRKIFTRKNL